MSDLWALAAMLFALLFGVFVFRLPTGISLALSAFAGAVAGGFGLPLPNVAAGTMLYLDPILIVVTSLFFMRVYEQSGSLSVMNQLLLKYFGGNAILLTIVLTLFVMFPGMLTGLTAPCILTTGAMIVPILLASGMTKARAAAFVAVAAFYGMVAPPVNICAMIIGGGVDMPYVNFGLPLALCTFPFAFASSLWITRAHRAGLKAAAQRAFRKEESQTSFRAILPLLFLCGSMAITQWLPRFDLHLGIPLLFIIAAVISMLTATRVNLLPAADWTVRQSLSVLALLAGVGMFIEILTLTGARGLIVVNTLIMPHWLRDIGTAILVPLFGGVSAYGSSSVLGVPLLLSMLEKNGIIVAAALSLLASVGDFVPPTKLAVVLSGQVTDEPRTWPILKSCIAPALLAIIVGVTMIYFANPIAKVLGLA